MDLYARYVANFPAALIRLEKLKSSSRNFDAIIKVCFGRFVVCTSGGSDDSHTHAQSQRAQSVSNEGEELEVLLSYPQNRILQYRRFAEVRNLSAFATAYSRVFTFPSPISIIASHGCMRADRADAPYAQWRHPRTATDRGRSE